MRLITLPFAGGNKYSYAFLKKEMNSVEIISLEYPGRGARMSEPLQDNIDIIVEDVFLQIKAVCNEPYIIYGHSMGALVSYLVCVKLQESQLGLPECLIVSGRYAPTINKEKETYRLPSDEFWNKMLELDGTPVEIIQEMKLRVFFEPILRNDFKLVETYMSKKLPLLNIPIEVLYGSEEAKNDPEPFFKWKEVTTEKVNFHQFEGGHFFILRKQQEIANLILNKFSHVEMTAKNQ